MKTLFVFRVTLVVVHIFSALNEKVFILNNIPACREQTSEYENLLEMGSRSVGMLGHLFCFIEIFTGL